MKFPGLFSLLLVLFFGSATAQNTDSLFMRSAITKLENAKKYTLKVAELMPEEKYAFKPTASEMNFGEQLLHLAANLGWLSSHYLSNAKNPVAADDARLKNKKDITKTVERTYDFALQALKQFKPGGLADTVNFFAGPMTKLQVINLINDHQTHHRGQMLVYLRLNDITPPAYIGW